MALTKNPKQGNPLEPTAKNSLHFTTHTELLRRKGRLRKYLEEGYEGSREPADVKELINVIDWQLSNSELGQGIKGYIAPKPKAQPKGPRPLCLWSEVELRAECRKLKLDPVEGSRGEMTALIEAERAGE